MKNIKRTISLLLSILLIASFFSGCGKKESGNEEKLISALKAEAEERIANAGKPQKFDTTISESSQSIDYPSTFDLRAIDTDGDGKLENYVTSVKLQNPFGTCWAFSAIAAAETSILFDLKQDAVEVLSDGTKKDSLDLSEHHLGWFAYTPISIGSEQDGEGLFSQVEGVEDNPSERLNSGSSQYAAGFVFASGAGPLVEPDFDTASGDDAALNYHGKEMNVVDASNNSHQYSKDDDWTVPDSLRFRQSYMLKDVYFLQSPVRYDDGGSYDMNYAKTVINSYKEQLLNGRAISIAYCADNYFPNKEAAVAKYINTSDGTWAHYCYDAHRANHGVTIVGWDDSYPASNFLSEVQILDDNRQPVYNSDGTPKTDSVSQPPEDGAWIVKNSWGAIDSIGQGLCIREWGYEGSGYFYLSYYDTSIETAQCFDFDVTNELKADLGEYILQENDFMPSEVPHAVSTDFPVDIANLFEAEDDETIKALSITTTNVDEEVTFSIYKQKNTSRPLSSKNAKLLSKFTVVFPYAGLHVVSVPEAISLEKGEKFAVCACQKDGDSYVFSVGSEYNQKGFDQGFCDDNYAAVAIVNEGESYIYLEGEDRWVDFALIKQALESDDGASQYLTYDNFPIKVYASINAA